MRFMKISLDTLGDSGTKETACPVGRPAGRLLAWRFKKKKKGFKTYFGSGLDKPVSIFQIWPMINC